MQPTSLVRLAPRLAPPAARRTLAASRLGSRALARSLGLALGLGLALAALAACHDELAPDQEPAHPERPAQLAAPRCVAHQGLPHCALGAATLTPSRDGASLWVGGLGDAQRDGVAILLPEVTRFAQTGDVLGPAGSSLLARSMSDGVATSSLVAQSRRGVVELSATFTGAGAPLDYQARLYHLGARVGTLQLGQGASLPIVDPNEGEDFDADGDSDFHIDPAGACIWGVALRGRAAVRLPDGRTVKVDRVELAEQVSVRGSYPYLTFDRIDYLSSMGAFTLRAETTR